MIVEKKVKPIQFEERVNPKLDLSLFQKRSSGKTSSGIVIGYMKRLKNARASLEFLKILESLYRDIKNLETSERVVFDSWRNRSGIEFLIFPHKVIGVRYRKYDRGEKAKEVRTEMTKEEINKVIWAINKLDKRKNIPTSEIAELVYRKNWKSVFASRPQHILLVEILNYLEYRGDIHYYRSGKVKVLRKLNWW